MVTGERRAPKRLYSNLAFLNAARRLNERPTSHDSRTKLLSKMKKKLYFPFTLLLFIFNFFIIKNDPTTVDGRAQVIAEMRRVRPSRAIAASRVRQTRKLRSSLYRKITSLGFLWQTGYTKISKEEKRSKCGLIGTPHLYTRSLFRSFGINVSLS